MKQSQHANREFKREILNLLARQSRRVPITKLPAVALLVALGWLHAPQAHLIAWFCAVCGVLLVRWLLLSAIDRRHEDTPEQGLQLGIWLSLLNGVVMGASLVFFPYLPEVQRSILTLVLLGLSVGAIPTTAGYLPIYLSYMLPINLPLVFMWASVPLEGQPAWLGPALAVMLTLFLALMLSLARDSARLYRDSFQIRTEQAETNERLRTALIQAEQASRTKTRFLAAASHDLRQPVHTLSLFVAALSRRPLDEKSRQISLHMDNAVHALASQLDALLDISKLDAGVVESNPQDLALRPLVNRLFEEHLPAARAQNLYLGVNVDADLSVHTDPVLLERILRNLIGNALKYTHEGSVDITLTRHQGLARITISDTGAGIPAGEQARIFEEFYQLENPERDRAKGLGLGLAIVRRLADLLQLTITLDSRPGQGSHFHLDLQPTQGRHEQAKPASARASLNWAALRVLVVDDEEAVRLAMATLLQELRCEVDIADSTEAAQALARQHQPDLVISDLRLRGDDTGLRVISAIREIYPDTPALLISGDTAPDRLQLPDQASIPLLHKPVSLQQLTETLAQLYPERATEHLST